MIIGKKGGEVEALRDEIAKIAKVPVHITIEEVRKPELDAKLVAESIAQQLEQPYYVPSRNETSCANSTAQWRLGN